MNAIRIGLGGAILCVIALPYALLLAIPYSLRWLLLPLAKATGVEPQLCSGITATAVVETRSTMRTHPHGSTLHRQLLAPTRLARNSASLTTLVRRAHQAHKNAPIAHHAHSRRHPKPLGPQVA